MGKAFAILLIVLGVWLGLEVFTKGTDGAWGGIFASGSTTAASEPPAQRIRDRMERSMKAQATRTASGIGEGPEPDEIPADDYGDTDEFGSEE